MLLRCDGMYTKRGGDFGRKTNGMKGLANAKRVYRESEKKNGEIAGSPPGSKITYVFPLFAFSTCYSELRCKTHLPDTTIKLFTRGAESFSFSYTRCHIMKQQRHQFQRAGRCKLFEMFNLL